MQVCQPDRGKRMEKINRPPVSVIFILLMLFLILSCFRPQVQKIHDKGVYHLVKKDETVQLIAQSYGVSLKNLAATNKITDVNSVKEGSVIFIPSASQVRDVIKDVKNKDTEAGFKAKKYESDDRNKDFKKIKIETEAPTVKPEEETLHVAQYQKTQSSALKIVKEPVPVKTIASKKLSNEKIESKSKEIKYEENIPTDKNMFTWPVKGIVKTRFGIQPNKTYHNWIKIVSNAGKKVKAAASGTVIFSSNLKNYGETIIIRHKGNYATVYTHLKKRYVRIDQTVKKGETIALLGEKDDAGQVYMNFEIRLKGKARNPMYFLP
jgi:lipoprotein NlpD